MSRGRRTKLTPEVQDRIVRAILAGYTLTAAAHHAGIHKATLFYWLRRGEISGDLEFSDFSDSVRAALEKRKEIMVQGNPRRLARARYEYGKTPQQIAMDLAEEVNRLVTEGRVPMEVALVGLGMAVADIEDRLADGSLEHCEKFTPIYSLGGEEIDE